MSQEDLMIVGEKNVLNEYDMLKIAGRPYVSFDNLLPLQNLPGIEDAIVQSYPLIKQNTWQRTTSLQGELTNCNWSAKNQKSSSAQDYFEIEVRNQTVAPMWTLDLTSCSSEKNLNLYDSHETPLEEWKSIVFRSDLPASWDPMIEWIENLSCFERIGRTSLLLTRPGIPTHYHRDIGVSDNDFIPYAHRQEFLWVNMTQQKSVYILDAQRNPIRFQCRSAFFNHHNWHGSHEALPYWSFSFKIEGIFKESFRVEAGFGDQEKYF